MSALTRSAEVTRALERRIAREHKRIINEIVSRFGLDRREVEKTVRGRSLGVMEMQT